MLDSGQEARGGGGKRVGFMGPLCRWALLRVRQAKVQAYQHPAAGEFGSRVVGVAEVVVPAARGRRSPCRFAGALPSSQCIGSKSHLCGHRLVGGKNCPGDSSLP